MSWKRVRSAYTVVPLSLLSSSPSRSSTLFLLFLLFNILLLIILLLGISISLSLDLLLVSLLLVLVFRLSELPSGGLGVPLGALGDDVGLADGGIDLGFLGQGLVTELLPADVRCAIGMSAGKSHVVGRDELD